MGGSGVVRLAERLLGDLPVAGQYLLHMTLDVAVFEIPALEVLRKVAHEVGERARVGVGVDEHETAPRVDLRLWQSELVGCYVLEVPPGRHGLEFAVECPGPAVERASELRAPTVVVLELTTAMQTRVVKGLDLARRGARDQERQVGDLVDHMTADFGDLFLATGELPCTLPETLYLLKVPLARDEPIDGKIVTAQEAWRLDAEDVGNRKFVGVEQLLVRDPRRPWTGRCDLLCHRVRALSTAPSERSVGWLLESDSSLPTSTWRMGGGPEPRISQFENSLGLGLCSKQPTSS